MIINFSATIGCDQNLKWMRYREGKLEKRKSLEERERKGKENEGAGTVGFLRALQIHFFS